MNPPPNIKAPRLWPAGTLPDMDSLQHALERAVARDSSDALLKAQALLFSDDVCDSDDTVLQVAAAFRALAISPLCADAYLELANLLNLVLPERKRMLWMALEAGEKALGREMFAENRGDFWGILETRPYMRARAQLADLAREEGEWRHAADEYAELLELNDNDNLGCRYMLMACLLRLDDHDSLDKLFARCAGEDSAHMLYTQTLVAFKRRGPNSKAAAELARRAMKENKHVPFFLVEYDGYQYELEDYSVGAETEAMAYSDLFGEIWNNTKGAVAWLLKTTRPGKKTRGKKA